MKTSPIRILLTGKNGQVGWELQRTLAVLGEVISVDHAAMNLANPDSIRSTIGDIKPNLIINTAAYTAVDKAESEPVIAMKINGDAPGIIAEEAKRLGAAIIHYSTDYVFDGNKTSAYTETDTPNPISVYGKTKLAGEQSIAAVGVSHLIIRTSWIYSLRGDNFLLTVKKLAKERSELKIVSDQIGAPTWARTIAEATAFTIARLRNQLSDIPSGIYHMTSAGSTSWYGFTKAILEKLDDHHFPKVKAITTGDYPTPAKRPANSTLSTEKISETFGIALPHWEQGLELCID